MWNNSIIIEKENIFNKGFDTLGVLTTPRRPSPVATINNANIGAQAPNAAKFCGVEGEGTVVPTATAIAMIILFLGIIFVCGTEFEFIGVSTPPAPVTVTYNNNTGAQTPIVLNFDNFYEEKGAGVPLHIPRVVSAQTHQVCICFFFVVFVFFFLGTPLVFCVFLIGGAVSTPRPTRAYDSNKILFIEKEKGYVYGIDLLLLLLLIVKNFVEKRSINFAVLTAATIMTNNEYIGALALAPQQ